MTKIKEKFIQLPDSFAPFQKNRVRFSLFPQDKGVRFYGKKVSMIKNFFAYFHIGKGSLIVHDNKNEVKYISKKSLDHCFQRHKPEKANRNWIKIHGYATSITAMFSFSVLKNPSNLENSITLLEKIETPESLFVQGSIYEDAKEDIPKAIECYFKAAEKDHADAVISLLTLVRDAKPDEKIDYNRYLEVCKKFGEKGFGEFYFEMGSVYIKHMTPANYVEAKKCFEKAAEMGHLKAKVKVGLLLITKKLEGIESDHERGFKLLRYGAYHKDPEAYFPLALLYSLKKQNVINNISTIKWLKKAALEAKNSNACYILGDIYSEGKRDQKKDLSEAKKWYQKAADLGHAEAKNKIISLESRG